MNILPNPKAIELPQEALKALITAGNDKFVFIKSALSVYQYANPLFLNMMGLNSLDDIRNQTDADLCRDKQKARVYVQDDEKVIDLEKPAIICEEVIPKHNPVFQEILTGTLYPLHTGEGVPSAVLGICGYQRVVKKLTIELSLMMTTAELDYVLTKPRYIINVFNRKISLSKREIQCLIELIKGNRAGETALLLSLKQTTIESYINNLKNKLGATSKSSLINTVLAQEIIQQIVI